MLDDVLKKIEPSNSANKLKAKHRWDSMAKPLHGMGILEDYIAKIAGIQSEISIDKKCVAVLCADNGVVEEGVTQTGSEVTAIVAGNIAKGQATVSIMAQKAGADVIAYDVGMLTLADGVVNKKIANGTKNFAKEPAMTREQAIKSIETGIEIVKDLHAQGYTIIATGEMGIGNTTTSSAISAVLLNVDASKVTGKGAGLDQKGIQRKIKVIQDAITSLKPNADDAIDVVSKLGGFDIAAMCGMFIGSAYYKVPIIIDGIISSISALLAVRLNAHVRDYIFASHCSAEPAARMILDELGFASPLTCQMALGEGTGAVALMPILDMAMALYKDMPTFAEAKFEEYKPLC